MCLACLSLAQVNEQGESGDGSLEPGINSGEVFVVSYPHRFLEFYYATNPLDQSSGKTSAALQVADEARDEEEAQTEGGSKRKKAKVVEKAAIFKFFDLVSSTIICSGNRGRGQYTNIYKYQPSLAPPHTHLHRFFAALIFHCKPCFCLHALPTCCDALRPVEAYQEA